MHIFCAYDVHIIYDIISSSNSPSSSTLCNTVSSAFFADMSRGDYSVDDIENMELDILHSLSWRIYAPTSIQIAHGILSLVLPHHIHLKESTWGFILDEVRYQTEHSVRDYYLCIQRPSTIAMAALLNTLNQLNKKVRKAILHTLFSVVKKQQQFDSLDIILIATNRLSEAHYNFEENKSIVSDDIPRRLHFRQMNTLEH